MNIIGFLNLSEHRPKSGEWCLIDMPGGGYTAGRFNDKAGSFYCSGFEIKSLRWKKLTDR